MRRFGIGLLFGFVGYVIVAAAGYFLVLQFSANMHDRTVEAAMTSVFLVGPIGALVAFAVGVILSGRRPTVPTNDS